MRLLLLAPILYLAAVLETSLADALSIGHVGPDLLALVAVSWVLLSDSPRAFLTAGALGLFGDLISPGPPGLGLAVFLLVAYGAAQVRARLAMDHVALQVAAVWVAVSVMAAALALGRWLMGEPSAAPAAFLVRSLGVGAYTAGVALPLLMVVGWFREPRLAVQR